MAKRLVEFDLLKGVGILSVVLGHSAISEPLHEMIYSYHMPLFFMVSGYFFHVQPVQQYFKKMFFRLIVPWLFFVTLNLLFFFSLSLIASHNPLGALDYSLGLLAPLDEDCIPLYRSIWFLIALFVTGNLYNLLNNLLGQKAVHAVVLAFYFTGFVLQWIVNVPFFIDTSISVLLFYHLGTMARAFIDNSEKAGYFKRDDKRVFLSMSLPFGALMCLVVLLWPHIDFKTNTFPIWVPLLSAPIIITLHYMMKGLSRLTFMKPVSSFLVKCGIYSLCILGFHRLFQELFNIIFSKLSIANPSLQTAIYIIISIPVILMIARLLEKHAPILIGSKSK